MSVRGAKRVLTGMAWDRPTEVVLGFRPDGSRGVTVLPPGRESVSFTSAERLEELAEDLYEAAQYIRGDHALA